MRYYVTFPSGEEVTVEVTHLPTGEIRVSVGGQELDADTVAVAGAISTRIHGHVVDLFLEGTPPEVGVVAGAHRFYAKVESERMRAAAAALGTKGGSAGEGVVASPMPGRVVKVLVAEGDEVAAGQALVVVEAMKMENELAAGRAGKVTRLHVKPGDTVEGKAALVEIG